MRTNLTCAMALMLLLLPSFPWPAAGQVTPAGFAAELTADAMIARIREASRLIVHHSGKDQRARATATVITLDSLASRLERELHDHADEPIVRLRDDYKNAVTMGHAGLTLAEDAAATLRSCTHDDIAQALDALAANLERMFANPESWDAGAPRVVRVGAAETETYRTLRINAPQTVVLEGTELHSDDCGPASARISGPDGTVVDARAVSKDGLVEIDVPSLQQAGLHDITVRVRRRKLLFLCRSASASFTIAVLPEAAFRVEYRVSSMRRQVEEIVWNAGEMRLSNERCDNDTIASSSFRLPDGWTYASHEWIVFLSTGAEKTREEVRGNEVHVEYRLPRRGSLCLGPERLIHGKMEIHGTRTTIVPRPAVGGPLDRTLGFGESMSIPVRMDSVDASSIVEYSVDVRLIYPDGKVHAMAGRGSGALKGREPGGGAYVWDPEKARLRISAPARECRSGT